MKIPGNILFAATCAWLGLALVPQSRAETGTNTIDATTVNYTGTWMVGTNGPFNAQIVTNGGILAVTGAGIVGNSALAASNYVIVTGSGSLWSNSGNFTVGMTGAFNQLTITNGGRVVNAIGYIGNAAGSSNNTVLVTGNNSLWKNGNDLNVGYGSAGNQLIITNGGVVAVANTAYLGYNAGANNNRALVSGTGFVWTNSGALMIGFSSTGNSLTISNSGVVFAGTANIGYNAGATGNTVLVTGPGSHWNNSSDLYVGNSGSGNSLTISNSGVVAVGGITYVGYAAGASNNTALVTGSGSLWTNSGILYVGYAAGANNSQLTISDGGQVQDTKGVIGYDGASTTGLVTGVNSVWQNAGGLLVVGDHTSGNQLTISAGGAVINGEGNVGYAASASNNTVLVTGSGSLWTNTSDLYVGRSGVGNTLTITNSGAVTVGGNAYVGFNAGATNNQIALDGGTPDTDNRWRLLSIVGPQGPAGTPAPQASGANCQIQISDGNGQLASNENLVFVQGDGWNSVRCNWPTTDPAIAGALWNNNGVLNVSNG